MSRGRPFDLTGPDRARLTRPDPSGPERTGITRSDPTRLHWPTYAAIGHSRRRMRSRVLLSAASERASDERDMDAFAISVPRKHDSSPLLFVCRFCCLIGVANFFLSRISARTWFRGDHLATSGCSRYSQPVGQSVDWPVWSGRSPKVLCRTSDLQGHEEEYLVSAQGFRARSQRRTRTRTRSCEARRLFVFREAQFHSAEIQELEHPSIGLDWTGLEWSIFAHYMYILG